MIRVGENGSAVVSYLGNPANATVRFRGQHVRLIAKVGAVRQSLVQEAVEAVDYLKEIPAATGVDVCLRDVVQQADQETVDFKFDVLYSQASKEAKEASKQAVSTLDHIFNAPSPQTGTPRTCNVRWMSVAMGGVYDPIAPLFYGYARKADPT